MDSNPEVASVRQHYRLVSQYTVMYKYPCKCVYIYFILQSAAFFKASYSGAGIKKIDRRNLKQNEAQGGRPPASTG